MKKMKKMIKYLSIIIIFILFCLGTNVSATKAVELYEEKTVQIKIDYTKYNYVEITMPGDGYINIWTDETMVIVGFDNTDEADAKKIYNEDICKKNLQKGKHKIYLLDGAGATFWNDESAIIHYQIYADKVKTEIKTNDSLVEGDYTYYIIDDKSCGVKSYNGMQKDVIIPAEYKNRSVVEIGENAFEYAEIKSVVIPKTVYEIKRSAFAGCESLQNVAFETQSQLKIIGDSAFDSDYKMTSIAIPQEVTSIGDSAFYECENLMKVSFSPKSKLVKVKEYAFENCYKLTGVTIPKGVKKIEKGTFNGCKSLKRVVVSKQSKLRVIEAKAFSGCTSLRTIKLNTYGFKKIAKDAFLYDSKIKIYIPKKKRTNYLNIFKKIENIKLVVIK